MLNLNRYHHSQTVHRLVDCVCNANGQEQHAKVTAVYNTTCEALEQDQAVMSARDRGQLCILGCDVTDEHAVQSLFAKAESNMGDVVKILVGELSPSTRVVKLMSVNHAIYEDKPTPISQMSLAQFKKTHDVNLIGSFLLIRTFLQSLERLRLKGSESALGDTVSVVLIGSTGVCTSLG
jgi:NAD(P)-dependent dehydrogenase (short-subunit alcohol dehydrogenase family)